MQDNRACVEMIESGDRKKPMGITRILLDVTKMPKGDDKAFKAQLNEVMLCGVAPPARIACVGARSASSEISACVRTHH